MTITSSRREPFASYRTIGILSLSLIFTFSQGCGYLGARNKELVGGAQFMAGDYEASTKTLEESIAIKPKSTSALALLGWSYFKQEELDKATETFENLYAINDRDPDAHEGLAWCYSKKGRYQDSIREFNALLGLDSKRYSAFTRPRRGTHHEGGVCISRQSSFSHVLCTCLFFYDLSEQ